MAECKKVFTFLQRRCISLLLLNVKRPMSRQLNDRQFDTIHGIPRNLFRCTAWCTVHHNYVTYSVVLRNVRNNRCTASVLRYLFYYTAWCTINHHYVTYSVVRVRNNRSTATHRTTLPRYFFCCTVSRTQQHYYVVLRDVRYTILRYLLRCSA